MTQALAAESLANIFAEHEHRLDCLTADDRQWLAEHIPEALDLLIAAVRNRARPVAVLEAEVFRLTVDARSLGQMIAAGNYNYANDNITEKRFLITTDQVGEWEARYFHFDFDIESKDAKNRIETDDTENPWQVAQIGHLLAHGERHPEEQRKFPIIALGSVAGVLAGRCVPFLGRGVAYRSLRLSWWCLGWFRHCRFLAVRKVSVAPVLGDAAAA